MTLPPGMPRTYWAQIDPPPRRSTAFAECRTMNNVASTMAYCPPPPECRVEGEPCETVDDCCAGVSFMCVANLCTTGPG
jgi:hypothetical protein